MVARNATHRNHAQTLQTSSIERECDHSTKATCSHTDKINFDIESTVSQMTLHEKCVLLSGSDGWHTAGVPRLGIPRVMMSDGPNGLRKQTHGSDILGFTDSEPATCFPTESALACSFDPDLIQEIGKALGEECRRAGVSMLLGPGINMKRSPLCGRNFEYYSEDPVLAGTLAQAHIRGIQSVGVGASVKHFAGNSQEKARMSSDSVIAPRALHEIYLLAFSMAAASQPFSIMTAYNRLNGTYCSENEDILSRELRKTWGYRGVTVTDWEALSSLSKSMPAGLDLVMPGPRPDYTACIEESVTNHAIPESALDAAVRHILAFTKRCIDGHSIPYTCDVDAHLRLAEKAAERSAVLLKNDHHMLPLDPHARVAVIGAFAKSPRFQGTGSSRVHPLQTDAFLGEFRNIHNENDVEFAQGYDVKTGKASREQIHHARDIAAKSDAAIIYVGLPETLESEGFDRLDMRIPDSQVHLILEVCAANPHTAVIVVGGAPIEMPWRSRPEAILLTYLSGCQGGRAAARLVTGQAVPSGKLAETWPVRLEDTPTFGHFPDQSREILYTEDIYVGYRYYDAVGANVAYPFGYGLSYTTFAYRDMRVERASDSNATTNAGDALTHDDLAQHACRILCTITNTGNFDGREIVQVYVAPKDTTWYHAPQGLKAFQNVFLHKGESKRVEITLPVQAFAHWSTAHTAWVVTQGDYEIRIGASSRDIRLTYTMHMDGISAADDHAPARYYHPWPGCFALDAHSTGEHSAGTNSVCGAHPTDAHSTNTDSLRGDFKQIYGRDLPKQVPFKPFTLDSTLSDTGHTRVGRLFYPLVIRGLENVIKDEHVRQRYVSMLDDMPIKSVHMQGFSMNSANVMVDVLNGHYGKASRLWWKKRISDFKKHKEERKHEHTNH